MVRVLVNGQWQTEATNMVDFGNFNSPVDESEVSGVNGGTWLYNSNPGFSPFIRPNVFCDGVSVQQQRRNVLSDEPRSRELRMSFNLYTRTPRAYILAVDAASVGPRRWRSPGRISPFSCGRDAPHPTRSPIGVSDIGRRPRTVMVEQIGKPPCCRHGRSHRNFDGCNVLHAVRRCA